ncbi:hydroxyacylglutathione hydrolase [Rhodobacterales bacterium HKCCE2091]|nr:hydroxyacylglutathione hydrolase [Rhodobacterales bacterium HKCCE2091]
MHCIPSGARSGSDRHTTLTRSCEFAMAEIVTVPCRTDNYAFLLHDRETGKTLLVDAPETAPIADALAARGWLLSDILVTHHHDDHVAGVEELRAANGAAVWGASADAHRLPPLDHALAEGDTVTVGSLAGSVIEVPGHTIGHIAFHFPDQRLVFTADSLMALGCGRLFEGDAAMMWSSLQKLSALPHGTLVCSGHEYTEANARFAMTIESDNAALRARSAVINDTRNRGEPTVPSKLGEELATNPFLRAHLPEVKAAVGMEEASDVEVFAEIRSRKDRF